MTYNFQDKDKIMKYEFLETEDYENKTVSLEVDSELQDFIQFDQKQNKLIMAPKDKSQAGTYKITIKLKDEDDQTARKSFWITILWNKVNPVTINEKPEIKLTEA